MNEVVQPDETTRRRTWRWLLVAGLLTAMLACAWIGISAPRVSKESYARLQIGMPRSEVYSILGSSSYEKAVVGIVRGLNELTINDGSRTELLKKGYQDLMYEAWWSPELCIFAVFDREGQLVCFYRGNGQKQTVVGMFWPKTRAALPPPLSITPPEPQPPPTEKVETDSVRRRDRR